MCLYAIQKILLVTENCLHFLEMRSLNASLIYAISTLDF